MELQMQIEKEIKHLKKRKKKTHRTAQKNTGSCKQVGKEEDMMMPVICS